MIYKALLSSMMIFALLAGVAQAEVSAPTLKWQRGGCYTSWCETGWYSSPAVADIDGDGKVEVIASAYSIVVLDGATGNLKWRVNSGRDRSNPNDDNVGRTWPGIVVADVDGDGQFEIVTAHSGAYVSVYDYNGYFKLGWPQYVAANEFRGLSVADIDGDGKMEIIVTAATGSQTNTWVFGYDGNIRSGWPQLSNNTGFAWGVYNSNAAIGDIDGDGMAEIIVPSDVHYICAYKPTGVQVQSNSMYGTKAWGKVGVAVDLSVELRGYADCSSPASTEYRPNFADSPATIADVNNDGIPEVVVTGNVYNCGTDPYTSLYEGVFIFNADRSRFNASGFNWETVPTNLGAPISEDYNVIESCMSNPVVVDIDGDGDLEIVVNTANSGIVAYHLPNTKNARILWGTGRGNFRRTGSNFSCALDSVRISGVGFLSISNAYVAAASGHTIQAQAQNFTENINLTNRIPMTLRGGYDCQFLSNAGYTTVTGKVTVQNGTVTMDKIIIK